MAAVQRFRSAFNGFNREDVVHYIEYLNNQHKSQTEQLNTQLQAALAKATPADLQAQLDAALAKCDELEQQLAQARLEAEKAVSSAEAELEAYRRAERTERLAKERAQQIYTQANAALAEAALQADSAASHIGAITDQMVAQLQAYQQSVAGLDAAGIEYETKVWTAEEIFYPHAHYSWTPTFADESIRNWLFEQVR